MYHPEFRVVESIFFGLYYIGMSALNHMATKDTMQYNGMTKQQIHQFQQKEFIFEGLGFALGCLYPPAFLALGSARLFSAVISTF